MSFLDLMIRRGMLVMQYCERKENLQGLKTHLQ